jgi:hypothetical protein
MTENRVALMRALFADLAERVDAAYEPFAGQQPEAKFDSWLDQRTTEVLPSAARLSIDDAAAAEHFELAFSSAREVAQALGVQMPEIEAFAEAGVDLERFAAALADDPSLAPVPAPHGLGQAAWKQAFEALGGPLLLIADEAEREFAEVDGAALTGAPVAVGAERSAGGDALVSWTLRLVPAQPGPPLLGLSFAQGPHVTLPEMLMLQLSRVVAGEPLVDATSFTWLAGVLAGGKLAARHVYDEAEDTVRITCREVVSQGPHLGARPPVG